MNEAISTATQMTPAWLTATLRHAHVLPQGEVLALGQGPNSAFNSTIVHLRPTYSVQTETAPARLLLKCNIKEPWAIRAGAREVAFYRTVAELPDHPPVVVRCYDAAYDETTGDSHILLDDLSESHVMPITRDQQMDVRTSLPSETHLEQVVDTLARFHAYWWEHPRLGTGIAQIGAWCSDEEHVAVEVERHRRAWDDLLVGEVDWFPAHFNGIYEHVLDNYMRLWQRYTQPRLVTFQNLTLTHGDAYFANFLSPREGHTGTTYLIDWQSPEVYRGPADLVNMCATFWTHAQRSENQRERRVLQHYHSVLQANGVNDYSWDDLLTDYRCAIIDWLLIPLQDRLDGSGKAYWWPKMQCLADAFEDWECGELLGRGRL